MTGTFILSQNCFLCSLSFISSLYIYCLSLLIAFFHFVSGYSLIYCLYSANTMSLQKMQSLAIEEKSYDRRIEHAEEAVGTIVVNVNESGRHTLSCSRRWIQTSTYIT